MVTSIAIREEAEILFRCGEAFINRCRRLAPDLDLTLARGHLRNARNDGDAGHYASCAANSKRVIGAIFDGFKAEIKQLEDRFGSDLETWKLKTSILGWEADFESQGLVPTEERVSSWRSRFEIECQACAASVTPRSPKNIKQRGQAHVAKKSSRGPGRYKRRSTS